MRKRALVLAVLLTTFTCAAHAEVTRTLKVELTGDARGAFAVENLAGAMTVVLGDGPGVTAVATVHAESDDVAAEVRFEQVRGDDGNPSLRVRYPGGFARTFRYPHASGSSNVEYDGHRVRVSGSRGTLAWVVRRRRESTSPSSGGQSNA